MVSRNSRRNLSGDVSRHHLLAISTNERMTAYSEVILPVGHTRSTLRSSSAMRPRRALLGNETKSKRRHRRCSAPNRKLSNASEGIFNTHTWFQPCQGTGKGKRITTNEPTAQQSHGSGYPTCWKFGLFPSHGCFGKSSAGLREKKLFGRSSNSCQTVGITGHSSERGTW